MFYAAAISRNISMFMVLHMINWVNFLIHSFSSICDNNIFWLY
ncbi:hypothetical protein AO371_1002 [Moraxella catarrhalis]|nr:hypothetical protein AO371_1002 [Moraxella catarrhalis]